MTIELLDKMIVEADKFLASQGMNNDYAIELTVDNNLFREMEKKLLTKTPIVDGREVSGVYKFCKFNVGDTTSVRIVEIPKPTYRPFNDIDELIATWQKMMGYPAKANTMPLIWVKDSFGRICNIVGFDNKNGYVFLLADRGKSFSEMFEQYTFLDETPFGVAE